MMTKCSTTLLISLLDNVTNYYLVGCVIQKRRQNGRRCKLSKTTFLTEVQLLSKVTLDPGKSCSFYDTLGEQLKSLPELIHFLK